MLCCVSYLFRIKKKLNTSWKRALSLHETAPFCLTKGLLDDPEGQVEVESPLIRSFFDTFSSS